MKKVLRFLWSIVEIVVIAYVIVITAFVLCKNKFGYTQFGDYTFDNVTLLDERNIEDVKKGDLLVVENTNDVEKGDRIYYYAAYNEAYVVRSDYVVEIQKDDYSSLYTIQRGGEDVTVSSTRVLGKYSTVYHKIGGILELLESRVGFLFLVLLPIMIVFIYQVYEFITILRYEEVEKDAMEEKPKTKTEAKSKTVTKDEDVEIL